MRTVILAVAIVLGATPALAQFTQAGIDNEITTSFQSCGTGCITATQLRSVLHDMNAATFQAMPNAQLAQMPARTTKCNATTAPATPQDCAGNGYINVRDYAVCDGMTDDTTAINTADAAAAAQGRALYFPAGTCVAQGLNPRRSNLEWFGDGPYLSIIKFVPASAFDTLVWFGERTLTTQYANLYVHDLGFDGNSAGTNAVVELRNISESSFAYLRIFGGSNVGLRGDTSTATINTQLFRNNFDNIESFSNGNRGIFISGDKDSSYNDIFSHNNTSDGIYWGPANLNSSALCETTQIYGGTISARDNGGDGIVFDEAEKFVIASLQTSINNGYGLRFKSTYTGCTSTGSNSVNIGTMTARNDLLGGIRAADGAYVYGAKFGTVWIRGDNSTVGTVAVTLDGVEHTQFGSLQVEGWPGTAVLIQAGTPLGSTTQSNVIQFGNILLANNGNAGAGAGNNHGLSLQNNTTNIQIGTIASANLQTMGGSDFEIITSNTVVNVYISNAIINAAAAGSELSVGSGDIHIASRRTGTKTLLHGSSTAASDIFAFGGAAPAPSACGTGTPTVIGSNVAGLITTGTGTPVSCTITFASPGYTNAPYCVVTGQTSAQLVGYAVTNTTIVLTTTATSGVKANYICFGQSGG